MPNRRGNLLLKVSTLLGGFFLCLPDSGVWTWGNMSVYVLSYMRKTGVDDIGVETPWLMSLLLIGFTFGLMLAGVVCKLIGRRLTILLGLLIFDSGVFLSYFTVKISIWGLNITCGAMPGLGYGIAFGMVLQYVLEWSDSKQGLFTSIVLSSQAIGGAINIQIVSRYVNPSNKTPDLKIGQSIFFTQPDVLEKTPNVYLILGSVNVIFHIIGFSLLRDRGQKVTKDANENTPLQKDTTISKINQGEMSVHFHETTIGLSDADKGRQKDKLWNQNDRAVDKPDVGVRVNKIELEIEDSPTVKSNEKKAKPRQCAGRKTDYTPREMLRDKIFYVLWLVMVTNDFGYIVFTNYYKKFGQVYIHDDHFLADLGTTMAVCITATRIPWGALIDRLGVKWIMMIFTSLFVIFFCFIFFTPTVSPWIYFIWCLMLSSIDIGLYANFSVATYKYFGPKNFAVNYGLVVSSGIILNLAGPPIIKALMDLFGWFALFITSGFLNFFPLLLIIFIIPED